MPGKKLWLLIQYIGRVLIFLILLTLLLPKLAVICDIWISSIIRDEEKPNGNPMRVESHSWKEFVADLIPGSDSDPEP
ncbi:MAG: hypothetical protein PHZ11_09465 [Desulfitobacteriaceae bacterium]|nr:hypothetical protein [Desulfitobacteriaceae bacterium]MDD4347091.1 hypothetical protein [Desulfitobacteriaceae bacterium]MDD4402441.1 hypothetical protein [Desulfitobacteriaceae bacterium]